MIKTYNGDCISIMESKEYQEMIADRKICIITDPPFNINYHYKTYKDRKPEKEYQEMLKKVLTMNEAPFVVIHYPEQLYKIAATCECYPEKVVSWVYNSNTAKQHRDIAFFGIKPDFRKIKQPYKNPKDKRIMKRIANGIGGGQTLRLVEYQSSEKCIQEPRRRKSSMYNAIRSNEAHYWNTAKRFNDYRSIHGFRNNRGSM